MNFQEQVSLFCLAFRWYETTGTRLRQASCRTRFLICNLGYFSKRLEVLPVK